jgi:hypothetical protein
MHPVHDSVQARPHRRSSPEISPRHVSPGHVSFSITNPQVPPLWLSPAYPTAIVRLRLIAFNLPRQWCGWVGKNRFLYLDSLPLLSQHCLLPLSLALTQRWLSALTHSTTQQTRLLESSSLSRMAVFSYSNSVLLIILIMSYTIFVLYSGTPFRYHIPVTAISLLAVYPPENLSGVRVCYPTPAACIMQPQLQLQLQQQHACRFMHAGSCMLVHPVCTQQRQQHPSTAQHACMP